LSRIESQSYSDRSVVVVMATYNGERFLNEQLESILNQTIKPRLIFVSDDRSSDGTCEIIRRYSEEATVEVAVNAQNLGVIGNFKNAVNRVQGRDYIALSDQDDVWLPEKLEVLYTRLGAIDDGITPAMVYSDLVVVDRNRNVLNQSFWNELGQDGYQHNLQTLLFGNFVTGCTILMNQQMADHFKDMPIDVPMHDYWLALIGFSFGKVESVAAPLVLYRKHDANVAHSENYQKETNLKRRLGQLRRIFFGDSRYLKQELSIAFKFYEMYKEQLNDQQRRIFEDFLKLHGRSYLIKKLAFQKRFRGYWK
jgi:glycosyltransferase involved in cell wall biosynthesis